VMPTSGDQSYRERDLPKPSIFAGTRTPRSSSMWYAHTVSDQATRDRDENTRRQATWCQRPPSTKPDERACDRCDLLIPEHARPSGGNTSVRIAEEFANQAGRPNPLQRSASRSTRAPPPLPCTSPRQQHRTTVNTAKAEVVHAHAAVHVADSAETDDEHRHHHHEASRIHSR